jgi:hypothetical protein
MRFKKILRRQVDESQLESTISSWKRRVPYTFSLISAHRYKVVSLGTPKKIK